MQKSFLQEQHLHLHAGADVGLVEAVAQLRHNEITCEMRKRFNQNAVHTMQELREHAQERFGEAISASRSQLLTEANEELQRRSTQANELLEAERRRNRELQQRLEQAQSSVGRLEKKMDEQALALQRVEDENAEAILRKDRLTKRLEEQQRMVSDLLVANEAARTLAAGNRKPNPSVPIISFPSEKSCVSRSNYGTPLIEKLGDEAAGDYADDAKDHLRLPGPPGPPDEVQLPTRSPIANWSARGNSTSSRNCWFNPVQAQTRHSLAPHHLDENAYYKLRRQLPSHCECLAVP